MLFQYENSHRSDGERRRPDRLTNFFQNLYYSYIAQI